MPCVDMPLEQLKEYNGRNPRPADFDEFWDRSLEEMRAVDPKATLTPFQLPTEGVECFELTFTSTKGARIYAKYLRPAAKNAKYPTLLHFHGLSGASDSWVRLLSYAAQGFCIASMDCRGQGGLSEDVGGVKGTTYTTPFIRGQINSVQI